MAYSIVYTFMLITINCYTHTVSNPLAIIIIIDLTYLLNLNLVNWIMCELDYVRL